MRNPILYAHPSLGRWLTFVNRLAIRHFVRRALPLWNTVTAQGPTVSVACLFVIALFCLTVNENVDVPVPLVTAGTSQLWLEATVHAQPGARGDGPACRGRSRQRS